MKSVPSWLARHKLISFLLIVIGWMWLNRAPTPIPFLSPGTAMRTFETSDSTLGTPMNGSFNIAQKQTAPIMREESAPAPDVANRMVVQNSHMSIQVKNVPESIQAIKQHAETNGGYMVDANLSNPQEAASGTITVRIPAERLDESRAYYRSLGVKVVSENLEGTDVTDQFVDNEERLRILERNKARVEQIMDQAVEISDIMSIQQQLFSIQSQIDSIKGQQNYLEKTAALAKITVYLSTDELALPYAPGNEWRPALVFKQAVRSVLINAQYAGSLLIWVLVYAAVVVPLVGAFLLLKRYILPRKTA